MTTDLVTVQQLRNPLVLEERDREAAETVASHLLDAMAENTLRVYGSAWQQFQAWAKAGGHAVLPATTQAVALYLGHPAATGRSIASVQQVRSAISHFHAAAGMQKADNPAQHPVVAGAIRGWRNRAPAPRQVDALTSDAWPGSGRSSGCPGVAAGRMESAETAHRRAALNLAIIGVLADGGLRRSEAAPLTWGDVELWADRSGRLTIQKGKNQVEPATVAVTVATSRALREIRPEDAAPAAPVSGLTGETLANRVRAAAPAAGLGDRFTGHRGRIGMARRMVAAGAPSAAPGMMEAWGHDGRYIRGQNLRESTEVAYLNKRSLGAT